MKKIIILMLILLMQLLSAQTLKKVSILLDWKYQFEFAGYIAAKEKGFYQKYGLDVKIVEYNHNDIVKDVLSQKYNFGVYDDTLIEEKILGRPVKLVSSFFKRSALVLIVKPNIRELKDLENKTLMISAKDIQTFKKFSKERNIDISKITFVPHTFTITPFVNGDVDGFSAFITDEPYLLEKKGINYKIINPSDYGFLMYQGELFTSDKLAENNPVLVDRFRKATIEGWKYALDHKKEIAKIIWNKYSKRKSIDALLDEAEKLEGVIQRRIYPIGFINRKLIKTQFKYKAQELGKKIDVDKMVDSYIFQFSNPMNCDEKYLYLIKLHNFHINHPKLCITILIFIIILLLFVIYNKRIKKEKETIETLFYKVPVAYVLINYKTRIIKKVNHYTLKLFKVTNFTPNKITSEQFHLSHKAFLEFKEIIDDYIETYGSIEGFSINWKFKKSDGTIFWVNLKAVPYSKEECLWVLTDIDEIMKTKEKLAKEMAKAQKAVKVKEQFLANMSHEIRTPLNAMLGFVDIISQKETDAENQKYLEIIKKAGKQLLSIINDILDFSKIESGKLKIEHIEFNPQEEFETILTIFESQAKEKNIDLQINFSNLRWTINSDPTRIKQIISNFISNAIKFTPEGKKVICNINYNSKTEKLYIEVIDEGIGIPKEKLKTIFKPFSQADNSTTRKYGGTGLGLTITKNLIDLLRGKIKVESEVGKGSKFIVTIPAKKETLISEKENNKQENKKENEDKDIKFEGKILLVEDNKANQLFTKVILKTLGIKEIDIANDGVEAIEKVKNNNNYNLILMDENMPNMNGIKATIEIRKMGIATPIVAVTANALSGDKERFLNAGMSDYISKPINQDRIVEVFKKFLKKG